MSTTILINSTILIDGTGTEPIPGGAIKMEDGTIAAVGSTSDFGESGLDGATIIDVSGQTIMPGLINCHQHLDNRHGYGSYQSRAHQSVPYLVTRAVRNALLDLQEGVTTIRDVASKQGTNIELKQAINDGMIHGPHVVACVQPIAMTGGHGWQLCIEADGVNAVRSAARHLLKRGADLIKCMASGGFVSVGVDQPQSPQFSIEELRAAFEEAHDAGKPTTVHAHPPEAICRAIEAGVDCIEHAALVDKEAAELIAREEVWVVPTLGESAIIGERGLEFGRPAWLVELCKEKMPLRMQHFSYLVEAGVPFAVGTDVIGTMAEEIELMADGGLSNMEVIVAATRNGARVCNLGDKTGTLEVGKWADVIVLGDNPLDELSAMYQVKHVFKEGVHYLPEALAASIGKAPL